MAILGSPYLIKNCMVSNLVFYAQSTQYSYQGKVCMVSVDIKEHLKKKIKCSLFINSYTYSQKISFLIIYVLYIFCSIKIQCKTKTVKAN